MRWASLTVSIAVRSVYTVVFNFSFNCFERRPNFDKQRQSHTRYKSKGRRGFRIYQWLVVAVVVSSTLIQFSSKCPPLTPKVTSDKKLSQCRERVFKQKRFHFTLESVRVCYFLNCMRQAVPSFRPSMGKTVFAKRQPSCQWFITVSPGRSEMDSGRDIWGGSNDIRQIRVIACKFSVPDPHLTSSLCVFAGCNVTHRKFEFMSYPLVKTASSWLPLVCHSVSVWWTDRQTDRHTDLLWLLRRYVLQAMRRAVNTLLYCSYGQKYTEVNLCKTYMYLWQSTLLAVELW